MRKRVIVLIATLIVLSVGAVAVEWEETDRGTDVVLNSGTGLPAVVFYVTVEYSEIPANYHLNSEWEIYEVAGGVHVPIEGATTTEMVRGETLTVTAATFQVPVETGKTYGAKLSIRDTVNGLFHERTFTYSPADVLPIGISLRGWDGSLETIDLGELPDEELEELALLYDMLDGCKQYPVEKTVVSFLREDAAARPDTAVLLNGAVGEGEGIDRCTYSACGEGCCSPCVEHEEAEESPSEETETEEPAADVRIECIVYQGTEFETEGDEYVELKNYGDLGQDLVGWTLFNANDRSKAFTFSESFVLEPGMSVRVYTNEIHDNWGGFSFESEEAIWTNVVMYPVSLILLPVPPETTSSTGTAITLRIVLTLYTYTLSSRDDIALVQSQLTQFDQEFEGAVYVGSGSSVIGGGKTVFVHEIAMQILEAAALELRDR